MRNFFAGGGMSFAHLIGLGPKAPAASAQEDEGEDMSHAEAEECDEEEASAVSKEGEDDKKDGKKSGKKKTKKGAADKSGDEADDNSEDDEEDDSEEDDDKKDKNDAKSAAAFKRGRKAERGRTAKVLSNPASARNMELAAKLLCTTSMSGNSIVALLESTPAPRGSRLADRMEQTGDKKMTPGGSPELSGAAAIDQSWAVAMKSVAP